MPRMRLHISFEGEHSLGPGSSSRACGRPVSVVRRGDACWIPAERRYKDG
jgi:hypothetical protein